MGGGVFHAQTLRECKQGNVRGQGEIFPVQCRETLLDSRVKVQVTGAFRATGGFSPLGHLPRTHRQVVVEQAGEGEGHRGQRVCSELAAGRLLPAGRSLAPPPTSGSLRRASGLACTPRGNQCNKTFAPPPTRPRRTMCASVPLQVPTLTAARTTPDMKMAMNSGRP